MAPKCPGPQDHRRKINTREVESLTRQLLAAVGEDPDRPGLKDTPARVARAWREFIEYDPGTIDTCFESVQTDQMVVVSGMRVWSLCEHHLLPFWCDVSVGYVTGDRVLGLSKFARIAQQAAHRLQIQERLTQEIADEVARVTASPDVAVLARGRHLCMEMRGVRTPGLMSNQALRGVFLTDPAARAEFLSVATPQRDA